MTIFRDRLVIFTLPSGDAKSIRLLYDDVFPFMDAIETMGGQIITTFRLEPEQLTPRQQHLEMAKRHTEAAASFKA